MKKHGIMVLALVVAVSFMFTSCDAAQAFIDALYSVSGKVVNIKASASTAYYKSSKSTATLVGATVTYTLTSDANKRYTGTVNSEGTYTNSSVPNGR